MSVDNGIVHIVFDEFYKKTEEGGGRMKFELTYEIPIGSPRE